MSRDKTPADYTATEKQFLAALELQLNSSALSVDLRQRIENAAKQALAGKGESTATALKQVLEQSAADYLKEQDSKLQQQRDRATLYTNRFRPDDQSAGATYVRAIDSIRAVGDIKDALQANGSEHTDIAIEMPKLRQLVDKSGLKSR